MKQEAVTKVFALGGLGEVGKNTYCLEHQDEIIIIDAGIKFPEKMFFGVRKIIPDYQYLVKNQTKIKGLFITHGHEDHIGGIPFLLKKVQIPQIYSPLLASDLIRLKIKNKHKKTQVVEFNETSEFRFKHFQVTFFAVSHSIPNSFGVCVQTPNGVVVSTGDFKLDWTPLGNKTSLQKISQIGAKGVTLLLSDSTNAEIAGYTTTEIKIIDNISKIIARSKKKVFVTTFASNFNRIFWIIQFAQKLGKKVAVVGKAIQNIIEIIKKRRYFSIDPAIFVEEEKIKNFAPEKMVVICTGSQGETNSTISQIANGEHKIIQGGSNDLIIFSSRPIPGNAYGVEDIVNKLQKRQVEVHISSDSKQLHTSGHACQEEQKIILSLFKPQFFMPMHGEHRMLKIHGETAIALGIPKKNVFICQNGDQVYLKKGFAWIGNYLPVKNVFIGDKDNEETMTLLNERQLMLKNGFLGVVLFFDQTTKQLCSKPQLIFQGSFSVAEERKVGELITKQLLGEINPLFKKQNFVEQLIIEKAETIVSHLIYVEKKINPLISVQILKIN